MAELVFNIAKGRVAELYNRVDSNDPAASAIIIVPVSRGAVTDATMKDFATLSAVLAGGVTERTASGWNRKTLTDTELAAMTVTSGSPATLPAGAATEAAVALLPMAVGVP